MFITFEGIDGCGKTTQAKLFFEYLKKNAKDDDVIFTREPGGFDGEPNFRQILTSGCLENVASEVFVFMADRAEHASRVITPAIKQGKTIVMDRYHDSTVAYQCYGRQLDKMTVEKMFEFANLPTPDITFYFEISVEDSYARVLNRGNLDSIEKSGQEFMKRVKNGFDSLARDNKDRIITIKSSEKSIAEIHEEVVKCYENFIKAR